MERCKQNREKRGGDDKESTTTQTKSTIAQYTIQVQITETQFYCSTKEKAHARDENKLRQEIRLH